MKPTATRPDTAQDQPAGMPSDTLRTIVTLLLLIHLFVVGLAVTTSSESGASQLLRAIKEKPRFIEAYLTELWLDRGYDYYLMNDQNWDFHLEATVTYADGRTEGPIQIPDVDLGPGERRQRYQQLAAFVANYIARGNAPEASVLDGQRKLLLPESIGAAFLKTSPNAVSVSLKCIYHRGISREEVRSENARDRDPFGPQYFTTVGEMTIVLDRGRPTVFESLPALEVSPLKKPGAESNRSPSPDGASSGSGTGK